ncbi:MAG: aryl-sulfate sulfotransferase [Saprospiraceae bacterium]|nr:aryl-sulfate sulfotransferase [Saprospiraceae bacterium]
MRIIIAVAVMFFSLSSSAQSTIGLMQYDNQNMDGYVLFTGISSTKTYLVDKCGRQVNQWSSSYRPGLSVSLLPNSDLFRTGFLNSSYFGTGGGKGGVLEKYNWAGNLLWSYQISDSTQCQHHDAMVLPNGNILAIVWERITSAQATQAGKNPAVTALLNNQEVWSEKIVEIQPLGINSANIVWQWNAWDHLIQDFDNTKDNFGVVNQHPELLNVNYVLQGPPTNSDWLHLNAIDYNPVTDQIIVSCHSFSEFWIIDHSTTTAQAASHTGGNAGKGGDLLYRWGNPIAYGRGVANDQKLFKQHHATFIKPGYPNAGKVSVFNNGVNRPGGNASSVDIVDIAQAGFPYTIGATTPYLPNATSWSYFAANPGSFYAPNISGVYPLANGSFMITNGPKGEIFEIDSTGTTKWRYINPVNNTGAMTQGTTPTLNTVFRAEFYTPSYPAFTSLTLTPTTEIELNPTVPSLCSIATGIADNIEANFNIYPNPIQNGNDLTIELNSTKDFQVELVNSIGQQIYFTTIFKQSNLSVLRLPYMIAGIYFLKINSGPDFYYRKIIVN